MLVTQAKSAPNKASNSVPQPAYGRNWNRNQRKRERKGQLPANGAREPFRNSGPTTPPDTVEVGTVPVVAQPMGSLTAEAGLNSKAHTGTVAGDVVVESAGNHPGYHTAEYAQPRADKLPVRNRDNLSAEVMVKYVKQLVNYLYSFTKILASPDPGAKSEVIKTWRFSNNGVAVITGRNIISVVCEILFFCKLYGNPLEGDAFLTPALDSISLHA